jgi:hypothetical protein
MIVDQFNVNRIGAFKAEYDSPICSDGNRPKPFKVAFERMQPVAREI